MVYILLLLLKHIQIIKRKTQIDSKNFEVFDHMYIIRNDIKISFVS